VIKLTWRKWKDRSADGPVSAKKPRKVKERQNKQTKKKNEEDQAFKGGGLDKLR